MKTKLLLILLMLMSVVFANAQRNTNRESALIFRHYVHNFGKLDYLEKVEHNFKFKNKSDKTVKITNVKAKCGCTAVEWPKKSLKPGKEYSIVIDYDTSITGRFYKPVFIFIENEKNPVKLSVTGIVKVPDKENPNYEKWKKKYNKQ